MVTADGRTSTTATCTVSTTAGCSVGFTLDVRLRDLNDMSLVAPDGTTLLTAFQHR